MQVWCLSSGLLSGRTHSISLHVLNLLLSLSNDTRLAASESMSTHRAELRAPKALLIIATMLSPCSAYPLKIAVHVFRLCGCLWVV